MAKVGDEFTVCLPVWAEYSIKVKLTEEMIGGDGEPDFDLVMDEAYENVPSGLCYSCSTGNTGAGWRDSSPVSLDLGEQPEVRYIFDSNGETVYGDPQQKLGW